MYDFFILHYIVIILILLSSTFGMMKKEEMYIIAYIKIKSTIYRMCFLCFQTVDRKYLV